MHGNQLAPVGSIQCIHREYIGAPAQAIAPRSLQRELAAGYTHTRVGTQCVRAYDR